MGVVIDLSVCLCCVYIQWEIGENLFLPLSSRDPSDPSTDLSDKYALTIKPLPQNANQSIRQRAELAGSTRKVGLFYRRPQGTFLQQIKTKQ